MPVIARRAAIASGLSLLAAPALAQRSPGVFPPWQGGSNNDTGHRGLEFTVPEADNLTDFHGNPMDPLLVLYVGGNYFFAMAPLVQAFEAAHPGFKGRIYWQTIPPGLLVKQMEAGGTVTVGNMTWTAQADAYFAGLGAVRRLIERGVLVGPAVPYVTNTLAIMVPKGNPAGIKGLADLGHPDIRLAMPNPEFEGLAEQIRASLVKAGGEALAEAVYGAKVRDGTTVLTTMHHRQTPVFLMQGRAQAGVTWQSEAVFQEQVGNPIGRVDIPDGMNTTGTYAGAVRKDAAHPEAARLWLDFITSDPGLRIFEGFGFRRHTGGAG